jgi:hypothetical protein
VDLRTGLAQVEERETGVWDGLVWLHPGSSTGEMKELVG